MKQLLFFKMIMIFFLFASCLSSKGDQNHILSNNPKVVYNDTNPNNIKMRKILNGDFTFKIIFDTGIEMPFELTIQNQGDDHLLSINNVNWMTRYSKKNYKNHYIEFQNGTFIIKDTIYNKFIKEIRNLDFSEFTCSDIAPFDGISECGIFYNNDDTLTTQFWSYTTFENMKYFNDFNCFMLNLVFCTLKNEPYITLVINVSWNLHYENNIQLIKTDPYYIIGFNDLDNKDAQELNNIIKSINNEPIILDLTNTKKIDTFFMTNLKNLLLTQNKFYLLINEKNNIFYKSKNKKKKSLDIDYLNYFNIDPKIVFKNVDSIYSIIRNANNIYRKYFYRYDPINDKNHPVSEVHIKADINEFIKFIDK